MGCALGFFADESVCKPCQCSQLGTKLDEKYLTPICDHLTGKCLCKKSVAGENCNRCRDGYFDITRDEVNHIFVFQDCHFGKVLIKLSSVSVLITDHFSGMHIM